MGYFENGWTVFVEIFRIWRLIDFESIGVKIVKNARQEPEILYLKRIMSGVLTNLPILVSKWCQDCQIAIKFIRDMQKGVGLAVVELIWYFIALCAHNITWHSLEQSHKNVRATAATNKYDPLCRLDYNWAGELKITPADQPIRNTHNLHYLTQNSAW